MWQNDYSDWNGGCLMMIPEVAMPSWFRKMNPMPEDPPNSEVYGYETSGAGCFVMCRPIPPEHAMPYDDPQAVIDGIHRELGDNQGLIEVERGKTGAGRRYLYSIVKTLQQSYGGVQYCMTMHIEYPECAVQVQGFFDELGSTGLRDCMVYNLLSQEGAGRTTDDGIESWCADPYDPGYTRGTLMNCSEKKGFDAQFPQHPLSEARRFVTELIALN